MKIKEIQRDPSNATATMGAYHSNTLLLSIHHMASTNLFMTDELWPIGPDVAGWVYNVYKPCV